MELIIEFIIIFILSVVQSIFGVGLLLFGTPIFLFIGYSFETTLTVLLPVSICISFLQITYQKNPIKSLIYEYNIFCLPFLMAFLVIAISIQTSIDIKIHVSILLIISSILILNKNKIIFINEYLLRYRKLCLIIIGSIHGATNMGGGFLSIFSTIVHGEDRELTRNYISYGYFTMGIIQYSIIICIGSHIIDFTKLYYVFLPLVLFFPSQKIFYKIDNQIFAKIINYFALIFGLVALVINL
jgi:uncharacterized membrane protein YfcA